MAALILTVHTVGALSEAWAAVDQAKVLRDLFARAKLGVVLVVVVYIVGLAAAPFAAATGPCAATGAPARDERRRAPMRLEVGG